MGQWSCRLVPPSTIPRTLGDTMMMQTLFFPQGIQLRETFVVWWAAHIQCNLHYSGFPGGSDSKEFAYNAGALGFIPGLGRSPEGGYGNPLQYSCLENAMNRGAWRASPWGRKESDTIGWLTHTGYITYVRNILGYGSTEEGAINP